MEISTKSEKITIFKKNIFNKIIYVIIIVLILFPTSHSQVFGISLSIYVGELGFTLCPVDALVCSIAYWLILVKRRREIEEEQTAMAKMNVAIPSINGWIWGGEILKFKIQFNFINIFSIQIEKKNIKILSA